MCLHIFVDLHCKRILLSLCQVDCLIERRGFQSVTVCIKKLRCKFSQTVIAINSGLGKAFFKAVFTEHKRNLVHLRIDASLLPVASNKIKCIFDFCHPEWDILLSGLQV